MTTYAHLVLCSAIGFIAVAYWKNISRSTTAKSLISMELPTPVPPDFDINTAKPRPYRPLRWRYIQNMAIKRLEPDWWLELESTYAFRIGQRKQLYELHGKGVINFLPGSESACEELALMVVQFLCTRYPRYFIFNQATSELQNLILGTKSFVRCPQASSLHFLTILLDNVPEDFLITQADQVTGLYTLRAAVSCSQVGWDLRLKMGKPLHEIHEPVPAYKEKLQFSMDRFFSRLDSDKSVQRGSWGLEIGQPLYLQSDDIEFSLRQSQKSDLRVEEIYFRVDWQTLRRLPRTRSIAFNFKALFTPVTQFRNEPFIPKLLHKILTEGDKDILGYKGTHHIEHKLIPALMVWAEEQEELGVVPRGWEPRTLDENPFFPGWESHM